MLHPGDGPHYGFSLNIRQLHDRMDDVIRNIIMFLPFQSSQDIRMNRVVLDV